MPGGATGVVTWPRVAMGGGLLAGAAVLVDGPRDAWDRVQRTARLAVQAVRDPHQALFVVRNLDDPWLARLGYDVLDDAKLRERERYGASDHLDDDADAFRHAYAAALMTLRAMRDHGATPAQARELVVGLGDAHERDGVDNGAHAAEMDRANNRFGVALVGDGRAGDGWLSEAEVEQLVAQAVAAGELVRIDGGGGIGPTGAA